jgi:tetratricopeptide (TPR) repeat protein
MLATIREFALERLVESGECEATQHRHAEYVLALAERAPWRDVGEEFGGWVRRMRSEHDNVREAMRYALESGSGELAIRLALALSGYWWARVPLREAREWLERVLALPEAAPRTPTRARLLQRLAGFTPGHAAGEEALAIHRELGDTRGITHGLIRLAQDLGFEGRWAEALPLVEELVARSAEAGRALQLAAARMALAWVVLNLGDVRRARELCLAAERVLRAARAGSLEWMLHTLGQAAQSEGDYDGARACFEEARAINELNATTGGFGMSLLYLGDLAIDTGDLAVAHSLLGEALTIQVEAGNQNYVALTLGAFARLAAALGRAERAVRLVAAAREVRARMGWVPDHSPFRAAYVERMLAPARASLDAAALQAADTAGRAMSFDQAVVYALDGVDLPPSTTTGEPVRGGNGSTPVGTG